MMYNMFKRDRVDKMGSLELCDEAKLGTTQIRVTEKNS
jgi:hypothetical protein